MKKLILTINQFDQQVSFDLLFLNSGFSNKIVNSFHIDFNNDIDFFQADSSEIINEIKSILKENHFDKTPINLNLNINSLFVEEFDIPKVTFTEERKAIALELEKLYQNYKKRFIYSKVGYLVNNQLKRIRVGFIDYKRYNFILKFVRKIQPRIVRVVAAPCAIYQAIVKNKLCDLKRPFLFVNVSSQLTNILVCKKGLVGYSLCNIGIKQNQELDGTEQYKLLNATMKDLSREAKRVLYKTGNSDIENIYINFEEYQGENAKILFGDNIQHEVSDLKSQPDLCSALSSIGALSFPMGLSFRLPIKVKEIKEKTTKNSKEKKPFFTLFKSK